MGGKKRPPISNAKRNDLLAKYNMLPAGRSERNKYPFTTEQYITMVTLRTHYTPKQIEEMLNISVFKVHKLVNAGKAMKKIEDMHLLRNTRDRALVDDLLNGDTSNNLDTSISAESTESTNSADYYSED